jgi:hypothetical protein
MEVANKKKQYAYNRLKKLKILLIIKDSNNPMQLFWFMRDDSGVHDIKDREEIIFVFSKASF